MRLTKKTLIKTLKSYLPVHAYFPAAISINCFRCSGKVYTHASKWMIEKNSSLPEKKYFDSHVSMEDFTYADYLCEKRVCKDFKVKKLGEYHGFYLQSDTLPADVFINFWNMYL